MEKTLELGVDNQGVEKVMTTKDYLTDGLGQLLLNAISGLIGMITYFYTDKIGVSAAVVANVLIVAKVVDAFTDLIMGKIMDKTKSKYGKARPWFLRMAIPALIVTISLFTVPTNLNGTGQMLYMLITNLLASAVVSTAISIPYAAMMVYRTSSMEERGKMGIVRAGFGYFVGMVIAIGLIPLSNALGGDQSAWIKLGIIFGAIASISMFVLFKNTQEVTNADEISGESDEEEPSFKAGIGLLLKNKHWVALLILNLFACIEFGISASSSAYYAKWILGDDNLVGLMGAVGLIPSLGGFLIVGPMIKKFGLSKSMMISLGMGVVALSVRVFTPASLMSTLVCGVFTTFATIPVMALTGPMTAMTIDYNDYKFGKKMTGMSSSASSFGGKVGGGLGAAIVGWCLAFGNYDAGLAAQPTSAVYAIYAFSIYIPLIIAVVMYLLVKQLAKLEEEYPTILEAIKNRKVTQEEI